MKWEAVPHRSNKHDVFADVETTTGTVRFLIRGVGSQRERCYVIRRNNKEIGRTETWDKAKAFAEAYSSEKLEGKAYAIRAIKLARDKMEEATEIIRTGDDGFGRIIVNWDAYDKLINEASLYFEAAKDVLEGRVPRFATLPEVES